eukprot:Rmarinus@m.19889
MIRLYNLVLLIGAAVAGHYENCYGDGMPCNPDPSVCCSERCEEYSASPTGFACVPKNSYLENCYGAGMPCDPEDQPSRCCSEQCTQDASTSLYTCTPYLHESGGGSMCLGKGAVCSPLSSDLCCSSVCAPNVFSSTDFACA